MLGQFPAAVLSMLMAEACCISDSLQQVTWVEGHVCFSRMCDDDDESAQVQRTNRGMNLRLQTLSQSDNCCR